MVHQNDWFDVEEVADGWRQITEGDPVLPCHLLVVEDGDDAVLIDTGLGIANLPALIDELVGTAEIPVILTHSHWDHIGAAGQFSDVRIHDRERTDDGRVTIDVLSDEFGHRPSQFIDNCIEEGLPFPDGFDPDTYAVDPVSNVRSIGAGEEITVGDRTLETVPIPGHSPGQLAILDRTAEICHGADILEPGGEIFAHFEDSDLSTYRESIARLVDLRDDGAYDTLTIGHGPPITGDDLAILDAVGNALDQIIAGDAAFEAIETSYGPTREYEIGDLTVLTEQ